jgi:hypothetical protein
MNAKQRGLTIALITGLIAIGVLLIALSGIRAVHAFRRIHEGGFGPRKPPPVSETDVELIRDWMTIPYIARTYGVPSEMLFKELDIPEKGNRDKNLHELNLDYYPNSDGIVLAKIKATIVEHQPPVSLTPPVP